MNIFSLKRWHKITLGILIFLAMVLFAAPRVGKYYIVKHSPELIGRTISIDKVRLNYFTGTLRIQNFKLFEADGKSVFLSFKRLKINIDYLPLLKNEYSIKYVYLDDPYVQVLQDGDKFNFSDLITSDTTSVAEKDTIPSEPAKYIINDIRILRGYVKYTDQQLDHTIALDSLTLEIPGFTWNSDSTNLDVNFDFVDGGGLYSSLAVNQADSTYSVKLKLDSLNLDILKPYVQSYMNVSAIHGFLSNDLQIKLSMQSIMKLFVSGINHIYGFKLIDTLDRTIFSFNDLAIDLDTFQLDKNRLRINSVTLKDPFILFEMIDTTNNWLALIKPTTEDQADTLTQSADTTGDSSDFTYNFPRLQISGGKVQFNDKTMRYPFSYSIDNIHIESSDAAGNPGKLDVKMTAGLNGTGNFSTEAIVNPEDFNDLDLGVSVKQFRMKDVNAYFMHYFGYPVTGGIMNFSTDNKFRSKSLTSDNILYFRKFILAEKTDKQAEFKIPLRLALGILSDKDGIIDLKAPVKTKGDEVKVTNLGKIIFRIIGNLFVKAAVSPFNALAGAFNVDPASLQEIKLSLTEPEPDEKNMKSVDVIANILADKPGLTADFYYCIDRTRAADTLAYIKAGEDYAGYARSTGLNIRNVPDSTLMKYIINKMPSGTSQGSGNIKLLCRTYFGENKLNAGIDSIRNLQTRFMSNYLGSDKGLAATRFRIIETAPDTIKPSLYYPAFRVYFTAGGENQ